MAKDEISGLGKDYIISKNPYECTGQASMEESMNTKSKFLAGEFKRSNIFNNGVYSDKAGVSHRASHATLHTTGDKF